MRELIIQYQGYLYFLGTILTTLGLYGYIVHLYRSEKKGERNYEQYANLALNDSLSDELVEARDNKKESASNK
jgi:cytochrome c oxidase cbb3-type subunit 4